MGATTLGQSGPGSNSNESVLHVLQDWSLTIAEGDYLSAEIQMSVYSPCLLGLWFWFKPVIQTCKLLNSSIAQ